MNKNRPQRGLGRGLSALMADVNQEDVTEKTSAVKSPDFYVAIEKIIPNPNQPRRTFEEEALSDLAGSIKEKGVIQPLIVRISPDNNEHYEIVAGERRWRASQRAGLSKLPVILREYSDTEVLEVAIIENIQRAELNAIEEAAGYKQLMEKFGHTQEKLSEALGKSRSHIANLMRLLNLPDDVQDYVVNGQLSAGHARALVTAENPSSIVSKIIDNGLSVRDVETLVKAQKNKDSKPKTTRQKVEKDSDTRALEIDLSENLGMKLTIDHKAGTEQGKITIKYDDLEELDRLCQLLSK